VKSIQGVMPDLETEMNDHTSPMSAIETDETPSGIRHYLRNKLILASKVKRLRAARLGRFIIASCEEQQSSADPVRCGSNLDVEMITILIEAVLAIPDHEKPAGVISVEDPAGCMIRNVYIIILEKLNALQMSQQKDEANLGARAEINAVDAGSNDEELPRYTEHCETCNTPIKFESLKWARCSNPQQTHQFSRCALTFLAIQQPLQAQFPMTKSCGLCELQFFSDEAIFELSQRPSRTQVRRPEEVPLQAGFLRNTNSDAGAHANNQNLGAHSARPGLIPADPELLENNIGSENIAREQSTSRVGNLDSSSRSSSSPSISSLAIALYATCTVCFYCGGQYTD
jgi:hypothetical protein